MGFGKFKTKICFWFLGKEARAGESSKRRRREERRGGRKGRRKKEEGTAAQPGRRDSEAEGKGTAGRDGDGGCRVAVYAEVREKRQGRLEERGKGERCGGGEGSAWWCWEVGEAGNGGGDG